MPPTPPLYGRYVLQLFKLADRDALGAITSKNRRMGLGFLNLELDRDAETHLTRCILRAALRRKLRRRDRKAAELKMNEFMHATRRGGRGKC